MFGQGLQLHQLLTQAFRDQHALTRAKARIRHLEKDLETSLAENKTLLAADQSGRALTKTKYAALIVRTCLLERRLRECDSAQCPSFLFFFLFLDSTMACSSLLS